jgi:hypothetical protein
VEELVLDDDPEHDWIDKIRRASASNEARQIAFMKLANQVQRKIGLKAINMGGKKKKKQQRIFKLVFILFGVFNSQEMQSLGSSSISTWKKTPSSLVESELA